MSPRLGRRVGSNPTGTTNIRRDIVSDCSYATGWALVAMWIGALALMGCGAETATVCSSFEQGRTICTEAMPSWMATELAQNLAGEPGIKTLVR